jgi:hypothetical protein
VRSRDKLDHHLAFEYAQAAARGDIQRDVAHLLFGVRRVTIMEGEAGAFVFNKRWHLLIALKHADFGGGERDGRVRSFITANFVAEFHLVAVHARNMCELLAEQRFDIRNGAAGNKRECASGRGMKIGQQRAQRVRDDDGVWAIGDLYERAVKIQKERVLAHVERRRGF